MGTLIEDIKKLRAKTGAGFASCKTALESSNNDFEKAVQHLKEMGLAEVAKRKGRNTNEGSIFTLVKGNFAAILELNCETDFVARNEDFVALGDSLLESIMEKKPTSITDELTEQVNACIATIKENMNIVRFKILEKKDSEIFSDYTHGSPAKLGTIVRLATESGSSSSSEEISKLAQNMALHAVAKTPLFLSKETVDESYKNAQLEILRTQVSRQGKTGELLEKIVLGKWNKLLNEICFLEQSWVFNEKTTVRKELEKAKQEHGDTLTVCDFIVYSLGEDE